MPVDLTGQVLVLGIKQGKTVLLSVTGTVAADAVTFDITYDLMVDAGIEPGKTYKFDFWNKTNRYTYIEEGQFKVDEVSHEVED